MAKHVAKASLLFGLHAVRAALENQPEKCIELLVQKGIEDKLHAVQQKAQQFGIALSLTKKTTLDNLTENANHQGIALRIKAAREFQENDLVALLDTIEGEPLLLVLDGVQDPHNLGACLRSAEVLGVDAVIVPKDRACDLTPTVRKVASGAAERLPFIRVSNLSRTLKILQECGLWIAGAAGEGTEQLDKIDFTRATALVMGNEGKGLRQLTRKACDHLFVIPMRGSTGSFNVSVACGICLYEVSRQRMNR